MKFLHISDLHIGKRVKNYSMLDSQRYVLAQIIDIINKERPDGVLIAGDIYDRMNPPEAAIECLDDFLVKLSETDAEIFAISGNHDSSSQIAFASRIIASSGIHMSPVYRGKVTPFTMEDEYGRVNVYMLPFVKPIHVRRCFENEEINDYSDAVRVAVRNMNIDTDERNILVAHQFVTGASVCEVETNVGGLDNVEASSFGEFDYVALGHIHTAQNIKKDRIRYSGAALKYGFDEKSQKSVTIVNIGEKGNIDTKTIPLVPLRDFVTIEGKFENIMEQYKYKELNDYVEIILNDEMDVPDAFRKLNDVFPYLMQIKYNNTRTRSLKEVCEVPDRKELSEMELISSLYEYQNNQPLTVEQTEYLQKVIEDVMGV